jgi:hypothetical protein
MPKTTPLEAMVERERVRPLPGGEGRKAAVSPWRPRSNSFRLLELQSDRRRQIDKISTRPFRRRIHSPCRAAEERGALDTESPRLL